MLTFFNGDFWLNNFFYSSFFDLWVRPAALSRLNSPGEE